MASLIVVSSNEPVEARQTSPPAWVEQDIGGPSIAGSTSTSASALTITAGGIDIWGASDQFHFVYQQVIGDVDVRARIDTLFIASPWSKAGVMIRAGLTPNAAHGFALVSAAQGTAFQRRLQDAAVTTHTAGPMTGAPYWVRLLRHGTTLTAYVSSDGASWSEIGRDTIALPAAVYVGVAVTSHNALAATTATVSQLAVTPLALPSGQQNADIGAPAVPGDAAYSSGTYHVHAGGADVWGTSDQFHYVYQPVTGDVDVAIRIASIALADPWSKAGVMIRETLDADAAHAFALISAGRGYAFQRRPFTAAQSLNTTGPAGAPPGWVRLKRAGSSFTAYQSIDGQTWTVMGSDSVDMADTVYVGIAVTSHNPSTATDVVADGFSLTTAASAAALTDVIFTASPDQDVVTSYRLDVFAAAADPDTSTPIAAMDAGKPAPDANDEITVSAASFFSALPPGNYQLTVSAIDPDGTGRSQPVTFTR